MTTQNRQMSNAKKIKINVVLNSICLDRVYMKPPPANVTVYPYACIVGICRIQCVFTWHLLQPVNVIQLDT